MELDIKHYIPYVGSKLTFEEESKTFVGVCSAFGDFVRTKKFEDWWIVQDRPMDLKPKFRRMSSIVNAITIDGRSFLPIRELERSFHHIIPQGGEGGSFKAWIFSLIRYGNVQHAPYCIVNQLCQWGFWIFEPEFFNEGVIAELK